jgi:hypothetical protein
MDRAAYQRVRDTAVAIGQAAQSLTVEELDEAIAMHEHAETLAPIVDPTLFMRANQQAGDVRRYLQGVRDFRAHVESFRGT